MSRKLLTLNCSILFIIMVNNRNKNEDRTPQIMEALKKATQQIIIEAKATNTYIVVSDGKGGVKKIFAKDL